MKTTGKKILIISLVMIIAGVLIGGLGLIFGGQPGITISRNGLHSSGEKANTYKLPKTKIDSYTNLNLKITSYADINVLPSDDDNYYIEYVLNGRYSKPSYQIENDTFSMGQNNYGATFLNLGFFDTETTSVNAYINLYIPTNKSLGEVTIYNDTGDVSIDSLTADSADIDIEYGDVNLKNNVYETLNLSLDTSDISATDTTAQTLTLYQEYGEATWKNFACDHADIKLDTSNLFLDAAKIQALECRTEYGDVTLLLPEELTTYQFDLSVEYGRIILPSEAPRGYATTEDDDMESYKTDGNKTNPIQVKSDTGNITIQNR
jgi:hypothetical protein